jgi:hypothetical protein
VILNLLNNAAKYTDPGGRIWLSVERDGGQAVVTVRENGSWMKPELVPNVFDLFTQGVRTPDRSQGGSAWASRRSNGLWKCTGALSRRAATAPARVARSSCGCRHSRRMRRHRIPREL